MKKPKKFWSKKIFFKPKKFRKKSEKPKKFRSIYEQIMNKNFFGIFGKNRNFFGRQIMNKLWTKKNKCSFWNYEQIVNIVKNLTIRTNVRHEQMFFFNYEQIMNIVKKLTNKKRTNVRPNKCSSAANKIWTNYELRYFFNNRRQTSPLFRYPPLPQLYYTTLFWICQPLFWNFFNFF